MMKYTQKAKQSADEKHQKMVLNEEQVLTFNKTSSDGQCCNNCFGSTQCNTTFHQVQTMQLFCHTRAYLSSGDSYYFFFRLEIVARSFMQLVMFYCKDHCCFILKISCLYPSPSPLKILYSAHFF